MSESNSQQPSELPEPLKQHYERAIAAINRVSELAAGSGSEGLARLWNQIEGSLQSVFRCVGGIPRVRERLAARPEFPIRAELAGLRRHAELADDPETRFHYERTCELLESELLTRSEMERDVEQVCEQIPKILEALDLAFAGILEFLKRHAPDESETASRQETLESIHAARSEIQWLAKNAAPLLSPAPEMSAEDQHFEDS